MARKDWDKVAQQQFTSLSQDIQSDWGDLYHRTHDR